MQKPDIDVHRGSVAGHLHRTENNQPHIPRSTVGTVTEIYDYMRLLCGRASACPTRPDHGTAASQAQTVSQMVDAASSRYG